MARTLIASDNFNRASLGADWGMVNTVRGNVVIDSSTRVWGEYAAIGDDHPTARWVGAGTFSDDQYSSAVIIDSTPPGSTYRFGVVVRASADTNGTRDYYEAYVALITSLVTTHLTKVVNGTKTDIYVSSSPTWADNDRIELEVQGTTLRVCKNGTPLGGSFTATDSSITTGKPGLSVTNQMYLDDWEGGDVTTVSGPTIGTQPAAQSANEGGTATFSVSATGTGTLHYAWERQPPGGGAYAAVGTDATPYTTGALDCATDHGAQFRVTVTDDNGPTVSSVVGLTVRAVTTTSRPAADVDTTGWTASTGTDFFALIDETTYSLTDYIDSPTITASPDWLTFALDYPRATGDVVIPVWASVPGGTGTLKVRLENDAATVVGSAADQAVTGTATRYDLPITISGPATRVSYAFVT